MVPSEETVLISGVETLDGLSMTDDDNESVRGAYLGECQTQGQCCHHILKIHAHIRQIETGRSAV